MDYQLKLDYMRRFYSLRRSGQTRAERLINRLLMRYMLRSLTTIQRAPKRGDFVLYVCKNELKFSPFQAHMKKYEGAFFDFKDDALETFNFITKPI